MSKHTKRHLASQKKTLDQLLRETYPDEEIRSKIAKDIEDRGTEKDILSGRLVLPHPRDAALHFDKLDAALQPPEE